MLSSDAWASATFCDAASARPAKKDYANIIAFISSPNAPQINPDCRVLIQFLGGILSF